MVAARVGRAMVIQLDRVNDRAGRPVATLLAELDDQDDLIDDLRQQIARLTAQLTENVNGSVQDFAGQVNINGRRLVPASVYARQHGVSVPTVNRALRAGRLLGKQQENKRWLVVADAPITKSSIKRGRRSKVA